MSAIFDLDREERKDEVVVKRNRLHLPAPHSIEQELYISSMAPITACCWGTKAGKTFGSTEWQTKYAWKNGGGDTQPHWWVAPIYRQAKIAVRLMKLFLPNDPERVRHLKTENRIEILDTGGNVHAAIEFRSGDDPDSLQGDGVRSVVVDEADRMKRDSWESLLTTITKTKAPVRVISSPKRRNWFYELCRQGMKLSAEEKRRLHAGDRSVSKAGVYYMNCPTRINPYVDPEEIERFKSLLPERAFRCYYLAEFPESDGLVFTNINAVFDGNIRFEKDPLPGDMYIAALDLAKHGDYTQLVIGSATRKVIVKVLRWRDGGWEGSWRRALKEAEHYNCADTIIDATTYGDPVLESMQNSDSPCHVTGYNFTGTSKGPLIQNLVLGIERADLHIPYEPYSYYCKEELEVYEFDMSESGHIKYGAPDGQHDDFVTALALWYWQLNHRILPGLRMVTDTKPIPVDVQDPEQISRMLEIEEQKAKAIWQQEARLRFKMLLSESDDD
jgi:hypothetical protein